MFKTVLNPDSLSFEGAGAAILLNQRHVLVRLCVLKQQAFRIHAPIKPRLRLISANSSAGDNFPWLTTD